jgi:hypothetical protein
METNCKLFNVAEAETLAAYLTNQDAAEGSDGWIYSTVRVGEFAAIEVRDADGFVLGQLGGM